MRSRFSILAITAKWRRNSAAAMIALVVSIVTSAASAFPDYPQRDSTQFLGSAAQFEGNSVPITQGTGGTGNPSGWSTNNGLLSIGNTSSVSETWFTIPGFTPNPNNGYTVEMRFKVTDAGTKYVGEFNPQGSTPGSLFSFAIKGDGIYDTLSTPNVPLYSGDLTDGFHTIRVAVAGNLDTINGPGNHAYLYIDGTPVGSGWTSAAPYAHTYGGPTRLLFGDTGGGIIDGAIQVDYLRADTTGSYAPLAPPIVVDSNQGTTFSRAIFGQNGFASPYISESRQAAYEKNLLLLEGTSIRGVAGGYWATNYNWKTRIDANQTVFHSSGQRAKGESTLEFLRIARDKGASLIITVNDTGIGIFGDDGSFHYTDTTLGTAASMARDWVRYTNHILPTYRQGDTITDPDDLRILNEMDWQGPDFRSDKLLAPGEAAVPKVTYWEIGNEIDYYGSPALYRDKYRTITQAMLQVDPTIKVGPNVVGVQAGLAEGYLHELLRNKAGVGRERVDFISYHPYGYQILGVADSDHAGITRELNEIKANLTYERSWIRDRISNSGRDPNSIELMATEWNPSTYDVNWSVRQYNGLGVVETAMTFVEQGLQAAHFWLWPAYIHTGDTMSQYLAFDALVKYGGDTLLKSYSEENLRLYVTRDSTTNTVAFWGLNFAFGDAGDNARSLQVALENLGFEDSKVTLMRLADSTGPTTLLSGISGGRPSVDWITSDLTGQIDLSNFSMTINPAEITLLVIQKWLPGDFNDDGSVDAADYVMWRKLEGTSFDLNGNGDDSAGSAGVVDQADYLLWRSNVGRTALGSSALVPPPIPEPLAHLVVATGLFVVVLKGSRRRIFFAAKANQ
jgi:hypothetical protein